MLRYRSLWLTCILLVAAWGMAYAGRAAARAQADTATAQQKPAETAQPQPYPTDKNLVNVGVMVTDDTGRIVGGLKGGNFRILDDGKPREIRYFAPPRTPMTIVLLMEYSSISYQYYAAKSAYWGARFLSELQPDDWIALVTYDLRPTVRVDFTHNSYAVRDAIGGLGFPTFRETNLFDAMIDVLDRLELVRGRKAILVLGTGTNSFSAATFNEVRQRLRESDVTVFCVGTAEQEIVRSMSTPAYYTMAKTQFEDFAKETGGIAYFPRFEGALGEIFPSIAALLRHEYTLGFVVPEENRDGRYHKLKVEIVDKDGNPLRVKDKKGKMRKLEVMARRGYIARRSR